MKLGILLISTPSHADIDTVIDVSKACVRLGHEVEIFLMDDGVYTIPRLLDAGLGEKVTICTHNANERGLENEDLEGVMQGSQFDLAGIVNSSDRFLVFG